MIPGHYLERPDEWQLGRVRVMRLKQSKRIREEAGNAPTASAGMSPETRRLLDTVRGRAGDGLSPEAIAAELKLSPIGVRNVLKLGRKAYDPGARGPIEMPILAAFRESWGRNGPWNGGNANGNGKGNGHQDGSL